VIRTTAPPASARSRSAVRTKPWCVGDPTAEAGSSATTSTSRAVIARSGRRERAGLYRGDSSCGWRFAVPAPGRRRTAGSRCRGTDWRPWRLRVSGHHGADGADRGEVSRRRWGSAPPQSPAGRLQRGGVAGQQSSARVIVDLHSWSRSAAVPSQASGEIRCLPSSRQAELRKCFATPYLARPLRDRAVVGPSVSLRTIARSEPSLATGRSGGRDASCPPETVRTPFLQVVPCSDSIPGVG
jgi:hypothetical protein